jgi:flagellin-like protein
MMQLRRFKRNNKGISTIIAAALIVAMTVIAAVALGATVLQIPSETQPIPQLTMSGTASVSANEITLTHLGGDPINTQTITFKTYIPNGPYADYRAVIPNKVENFDPGSLSTYNDGDVIPTASFVWSNSLPMYLQTDPLRVMDDYDAQYGLPTGTYGVRFGCTYLDQKYGTYYAPIQAGDTLVIDFSKSFALGQYDGPYSQWPYLYAPQIGQQFIVELYSGEQIVTSVTITVQA